MESRTTVQRERDFELQTEEVKKKSLEYDEAVKDRFKGDFIFGKHQVMTIENDIYNDNKMFHEELSKVSDNEDVQER